jgi:hypothetical protein
MKNTIPSQRLKKSSYAMDETPCRTGPFTDTLNGPNMLKRVHYILNHLLYSHEPYKRPIFWNISQICSFQTIYIEYGNIRFKYTYTVTAVNKKLEEQS